MKRWPLVASFVLFIALCATLAYWAMQVFKPPVRPVAAPPPSVQAPPNIDAAASLFGGKGNAAVASNFQLKGVIMASNPKDSVVILAADGKPAQAVRAGTEILPGVKIKEVDRRYVILLDNGVEKRVELPQENQLAMGGRVEGATAAPVATKPLPARPAPAMPATVVNNGQADGGAEAQPSSASAPDTGASTAASTAANPAPAPGPQSPAGTSSGSAAAPAAVPQSASPPPPAAPTATPQAPAPRTGMGSPPITNQGSLAGTAQSPAAPATPTMPGRPVAVPPRP